MKKILYIIVIGVATMLTASSCTEEAVDPKLENGGGGGSTGIL